jgi:TolA-binding protein
MALPWLTLIKAVPWADVIEHAPTVVSGAQKLWQRLPGRGGAAPTANPTTPAVADAGQSLSAQVTELRASVVAAEQQVAELQGRLSDSNALIRDMAEQQARMLAQIEAHRRALRWAAGLASVALVVAVGLLFR